MHPDDLPRLARALRERLEVNRLFGWSVPLRAKELLPPAAVPGPLGPPRPPRIARASLPPSLPGSPAPGPSFRATASDGDLEAERERRAALLAPIRAEVAQCTGCTLCHSRKKTVFGTGDPVARLLFVGEAPGFDEDRQGEPFVGKAGQLLNDIIKAMGLRREQVYIANIVKCRPPGNRVPDAAEIGSCSDYLGRQIEILSPEVVVALGTVAAKALLGSEVGITRLRGRFHSYRGIALMPTYHPAYLLRNPAEKRKVWEDVQLVMERLQLKRP
jgi:uracil-DNA glycosylase family 4